MAVHHTHLESASEAFESLAKLQSSHAVGAVDFDFDGTSTARRRHELVESRGQFCVVAFFAWLAIVRVIVAAVRGWD